MELVLQVSSVDTKLLKNVMQLTCYCNNIILGYAHARLQGCSEANCSVMY